MSEHPPATPETSSEPATCYRHPEREAHIRCTRCERRICPDCMVPASVGFQCPECVKEGNRGVRQGRTMFGGTVTDDPGWVTKVLIGINILAFIAQQASAEFTHRFWDIGLAVDPLIGNVVGVADGEYYRLLTSAFLHGNFLHIALNMVVLYQYGPALEAMLGRWRFAALYLLSAVGGSAASFAVASPQQPSLGASGAVFGLLGAYLVISKRLRQDLTPLYVLLAINLAIGFLVPRIDWRAHLGGLVVGALVALVVAYAPRAQRLVLQVTGMLAVLVLVVALVAWRTADLRAEWSGLF